MLKSKDLLTLWQLFTIKISGNTHEERLESYFGPQADNYDHFRWRILAGREALYKSVPLSENAVWVDYGGGTAANFEALGTKASSLKEVHILDLSSSMLKIAEQRIKKNLWKNFFLHCHDISKPWLKEISADIVSFSYTLSMCPLWIQALQNADRQLKSGGLVAVVDFYIADKYEALPDLRQSWWKRYIKPLFFVRDNVVMRSDLQLYLRSQYETIEFKRMTHRYPNTPLTIDYFLFVGRKK